MKTISARNIFLSVALLASVPFFVITNDDNGNSGAYNYGSEKNQGQRESNKGRGFAAGLFSLILTTLKSPVGVVDWVADKFWVQTLVSKVATMSLLKGGRLGNGIENHLIGLSRFLVLGITVPAAYYAWNKYQQWAEEKNQNVDTTRFFNFD